MSDTELWPEGTRRQYLTAKGVLAVGGVLCVWLLLDGWWSLAVGLAVFGTVLAWGLLGDPPRLVVTAESLERHGRRPPTAASRQDHEG